jgi:hypothetical protein
MKFRELMRPAGLAIQRKSGAEPAKMAGREIWFPDAVALRCRRRRGKRAHTGA